MAESDNEMSDNETPSPGGSIPRFRARAYPSDSAGPWVVYLKRKVKPLNVIQISKDLTKNYSSVTEITSVRRGSKLRVLVDNLKQANEIVVDQRFTLEYRVYIPAHKVEIEGVVTGESLTPEILEKEAVGRFRNPLLPQVAVLAAKQLGAVTVAEGKKSFSPTASFRVTFSGSSLPEYVELGKLRLPVRLFVPRVMHCQNCKQLGHTASHCNSKARCSKCGENHEDGACPDSAPKCVYCKAAPPHDLSSCPVYKERGEKLERSVMNRSRQSYAEMLKKATPSTSSSNRFQVLSDDNADGDSAGEGCSYTLAGDSSRKRRCIRQARVVKQEPPASMAKPKRGGEKVVSSPPGFRKVDHDQNSPSTSGTSKTPDSPVSGTQTPSSSGMFSLDDIVNSILKHVDISDTLKSIVLTVLPVVKTLLKLLSTKWPIVSAFISLDG